MTDAELDALADRIADRLAARLGESVASSRTSGSRQLVDAHTLATMLGTSRECVYRHATELGGQRIGSGPRGRLRFDPTVALERWHAQPEPSVAAARHPRRRATSTTTPLLPIRGDR